jgi:hypothetical protein
VEYLKTIGSSNCANCSPHPKHTQNNPTKKEFPTEKLAIVILL